MIRAGFSPGVRLFEAAPSGVPVVSDGWEGPDSFFVRGEEIAIARWPGDVPRVLREPPEAERQEIGRRARSRAESPECFFCGIGSPASPATEVAAGDAGPF